MAISNPEYRARKEITRHVLHASTRWILMFINFMTLPSTPRKQLHNDENASTPARVLSTPRDPFRAPFQPQQPTLFTLTMPVIRTDRTLNMRRCRKSPNWTKHFKAFERLVTLHSFIGALMRTDEPTRSPRWLTVSAPMIVKTENKYIDREYRVQEDLDMLQRAHIDWQEPTGEQEFPFWRDVRSLKVPCVRSRSSATSRPGKDYRARTWIYPCRRWYRAYKIYKVILLNAKYSTIPGKWYCLVAQLSSPTNIH